MKKLTFLLLTLAISLALHAQIAINTNGSAADNSAMLDVQSTTKGVLIPRTDTATVNNAGTPVAGLIIYQSSDNKFYYYSGTKWEVIAAGTNPVFERNGTTIRQVAHYGDDFIIGRDALPLNGEAINDKFLFFEKYKGAFRGGSLYNMANWSPDSIGIASFAYGYNTKAKGHYSTAMGAYSDASGYISTALGQQTFAPSAFETSLGSYNTNYTPNSTTAWNNNDRLFSIGNGTSESTRSNALAIYKNGSVAIGNTIPEPAAALEVSSITQGFLPPRMTADQMHAITSPTEGLMVYNTTVKSVYFYDGAIWQNVHNNDGTPDVPITYEGQTYQTVIIGDQIWMAENLNVGTMINSTNGGANSDGEQTNNGTVEKYCYDNNTANCDIYGGLYQWDEMMNYVTTEGTQGICPPGWHIPTDGEWQTLEMHLGMTQTEAGTDGWRGTHNEGGKLKEAGLTHWNTPNTGATNSSGFLALPGGNGYIDGSFDYLGNYGNWWSSNEFFLVALAWYRGLYYNADQVRRNRSSKAYGFSVRCLKD